MTYTTKKLRLFVLPNYLFLFSFVTVVGLVGSVTHAADATTTPDPKGLLEAAQTAGQVKSLEANMTMMLLGANDRSSTRELKIRTKGPNKQLIWFVSPADLRGTAFLRLQENGKTNMWLYLPAFQKMERISGGKAHHPFLGSDFTYADMGNRALTDFNHRYLGTETIAGTPTHKIESTLKQVSDDIPFTKIISYVDVAQTRLLHEDIFDRSGDLYKQKTVDSYAALPGHAIPQVVVMKDIQRKHETKITLSDIKIDNALSDQLFTTENLKRVR